MKTKIPSEIKKIAKHFELLGETEIKKTEDNRYLLTIRSVGSIDIESLFVLTKQYGIEKFYPQDNRKIVIIPNYVSIHKRNRTNESKRGDDSA